MSEILNKIFSYERKLILSALLSCALIGTTAGDLTEHIRYVDSLSKAQYQIYSKSEESGKRQFIMGMELALSTMGLGFSAMELGDLRRGKSRYR